MFNRVFSSVEQHNVTLRTPRPYVKMILQIAAFFILPGLSGITQAEMQKSILSVEEVNALIPIVEAVEVKAGEEKPFLNLKVDSEIRVETKSDLFDPCESWQRTPIYVSCTAWFGGSPEDKERIDVHKQVLRWQEGAAPYIESSYSVGFDGQYGRIARYSTRHNGRTHQAKEGKLLPDAPRQLRDNFLGGCTGKRFTSYFFFSSDENRTFSKLFRASATPAALEAKAFECVFEEFEGVQCIKFGSGEQPWGRETWWFDPSRRLALLGYEKTKKQSGGSDTLVTRIRINKLKEVGPDIWWLMKVTSVRAPLGPEKPWKRYIYRASNVIANDPDFDDSIFTVPFPEEYLIDDKVNKAKYRIGEDPNITK